MKRMLKGVLAAMFVVLLVIGMAGCDNGSDDPGIPSSVDDFSKLEPAMAPNPSRATARAGGNTQIGIPDYLLPDVDPSVRAVGGVEATFAVHEADAAIAQIVSQNGTTCTVKGLALGSARIIVTVGTKSATMVIAVAPSESFYTLPATQVKTLGTSTVASAWWTDSRPDTLPSDSESYTSDPTYQLAWNWRNMNQSLGASGTNCGIDILAYFVDPEVANRRGWVRTTYGFGGWHYDLNGESSKMTGGIQTDGKVTLKLTPEFVYDNGVPYLQITHTLTNTSTTALTGQKFGASADVMLFDMDHAPLTHLPYGALMSNEYTSYGVHYLPTVKLRLVCQGVQGISDVSTLWMGTYGSERNYVYEDQRDDINTGTIPDTALNFSYQNISLAAGESKNFVVRFTQVQ